MLHGSYHVIICFFGAYIFFFGIYFPFIILQKYRFWLVNKINEFVFTFLLALPQPLFRNTRNVLCQMSIWAKFSCLHKPNKNIFTGYNNE